MSGKNITPGSIESAIRRAAGSPRPSSTAIAGPRDFTADEDELTPTLKLKRNVVYDRYGDRFQALYDG